MSTHFELGVIWVHNVIRRGVHCKVCVMHMGVGYVLSSRWVEAGEIK